MNKMAQKWHKYCTKTAQNFYEHGPKMGRKHDKNKTLKCTTITELRPKCCKEKLCKYCTKMEPQCNKNKKQKLYKNGPKHTAIYEPELAHIWCQNTAGCANTEPQCARFSWLPL